MRKHLVLGLGIAMLLFTLATNVGNVDALAKVGNLMIEGDDVVLDGEVFIVPPGSEEVSITFDYTGASRSTIAVRIEGVGGLRLYETDARYSGDGAAAVTVRGVEFYAYLADAVENTSRELVSVVRDLSSASSMSSGEVFEHLTATENLLGTISSQLDILEGVQLEGDAASAAQDMRSAIEEIDLYLEEAKSLAVDDIEGRKARGKLMAGPADELRIAASTVATAIEGVDSAAFPESEGEWRYTVSARLTEGTNVQDAIADSVEFEVIEPGAPSVSSRAGDPTAAATTRSGGGTGGLSSRTGTPQAAKAAATQTAESIKSDAATQSAEGPNLSGRGTPVTSGGESDFDGGTDPEIDARATEAADATLVAMISGGSEDTGEEIGGEDAVSALPTWTVPANRARTSSDSGSAGTESDEESDLDADPEGGLNLGILFLGILALIAIAFWMRRRM